MCIRDSIYTSSKTRIMRQLYEDIHDMDLEELSEDDEETLGDYQKEKFETIIANENYEQIYTSRASLKTMQSRKYIENKIAQDVYKRQLSVWYWLPHRSAPWPVHGSGSRTWICASKGTCKESFAVYL